MADCYLTILAKFEGRTADELLPVRAGKATVLDAADLLGKAARTLPNVSVAVFVMDDSGSEPAGAIICDNVEVTDGDTITFSGFGTSVVLTVGTDFQEGADDDETALNLTAAINAHPQLRCLINATFQGPTSGACLVTMKFPGDFLENFSMATSDASAFTLGPIGIVTPGASGNANVFPRGVAK